MEQAEFRVIVFAILEINVFIIFYGASAALRLSTSLTRLDSTKQHTVESTVLFRHSYDVITIFSANVGAY